MKIRTKILLSFLLVVLIISVSSIFTKTILDENQSKIQTIIEIKSSFDEQQISSLKYISGSNPLNDISDSHIFIQHQLSDLITSSEQYKEILHKLQELELTVYEKQTNEKQDNSMINLLNKKNFAFEEFLEKNNAHIIRISEFKKYWGDDITNDVLNDVIVNIDKERKLILEFDPYHEDFEDIGNDFRNINNNVVDSLVLLLVSELDFVISSIDENDLQLQQTRNSLIAQQDIASQITATSFPSVQNKQAILAMVEPTKEIHLSNADEMTVSLGKSCESNIQSLENIGIITRQRHDVKEVGENKNPIQVLISVIKCQQGLRVNAEDYMNAEIMIKNNQDDIITPIHEQFDELANQIIFEKNSLFSNTSITVYSLFAVAILLIIILGVNLSNSISKPIHKLIDMNKKMSTGHEFVNVPSEGVEECRILADSFNNMINTIIESTQDLKNYKQALDNSSIVAITDTEGIITHVNENFCKISKYSKAELIGQNHRLLKSGYHNEQFYKSLWNTITSGKTWFGDIKNKAKDGSTYWVKTMIMPILNQDGKIEQYIAVRTDITSQIELTKKLVKSEKLSSIGQFASRMSHDLRNPLSIIKISLENLKTLHGIDETKQKQYEKIERSIHRMVHQIDNVLDFVKEKPLELKKESFSKIISESLDSLIIPNDIELVLPSNDIELVCDKTQFLAVMNNLILNGIQSIDGAGTIEIKCEEKDEVIIQVKDSGKGIPKEDLDKIFEPLFTTKQTGTGLGLAGVKLVIEAHGGIISVTSPPTVFTITLPKVSDKV